MYYVYEHYYINCDGDKIIFYVGKGKGSRAYKSGRNRYWKRIVEGINDYKVTCIAYFYSEVEALKMEKLLREFYWSIGQCRGSAEMY